MEKDTRQAILLAGKSLILQHGYTATSIDAICSEVGITKGAFYYFFASKAAFVEELLDHDWQPVWDTQESLEDSTNDVMTILYDHIDYMVEFILVDGRLMGILMQELAPKKPELREKLRNYFRRWTQILTSIIEVAKQRQQVPEVDAVSLMEFIIMTIEGVPAINNQLGKEAIKRAIVHLKAYIHIVLESPR